MCRVSMIRIRKVIHKDKPISQRTQILLFGNTTMADMTTCENAKNVYLILVFKRLRWDTSNNVSLRRML